MKVQVHFKIINHDYNQEYANEYHEGNESESNWKYTWAKSYELKNVKSVSIIEDEDFILKGKPEEITVEVKIPNVMIYRCHLEDGSKEDFAVSKTLLNKTHQAKKEGYDVTRFYFYINEEPRSIELSSNLIIDARDIPAEIA